MATKNAATASELGDLHRTTARVMTRALEHTEQMLDPIIEEDADGNKQVVHPGKEPNASLLSVVVSFLKNNEVTAQEDAVDEMSDLNGKLDGLAKKRGRTKPDLQLVPVAADG